MSNLTLTLGVYDGRPIEWDILDLEDGKALLLSRYALADKQYYPGFKIMTWQDSTLRSWLNGEFYENVFSDEEKERIIKAPVHNGDNPEYGTDGGDDTDDNVFLLSIDEISRYPSFRQGTYRNGEACWWWLRSPGQDGYHAADVYYTSAVRADGYFTDFEHGVRPAILISL